MKFAGVVVLYNPSKKINDNIQSYIKGIEKLYIVDNSSKDNSEIICRHNKIEYIPINFSDLVSFHDCSSLSTFILV